MILVVRGGELGGTFFWMLLMMLVTVLITRLPRRRSAQTPTGHRRRGPCDLVGVLAPGQVGLRRDVPDSPPSLSLSASWCSPSGTRIHPTGWSVCSSRRCCYCRSRAERAAWCCWSPDRPGLVFNRLFGVKPVRPFQLKRCGPHRGRCCRRGAACGGAALPSHQRMVRLVGADSNGGHRGGPRKGVPSGGFLLLGAVLSAATALLLADRGFAHDWGWQESGRDVGRLIQSPGFGRAAAHSMAAAIGAVLGALLPGAVAGEAASAGGATPPVSAPLPPTRILQGKTPWAGCNSRAWSRGPLRRLGQDRGLGQRRLPAAV